MGKRNWANDPKIRVTALFLAGVMLLSAASPALAQLDYLNSLLNGNDNTTGTVGNTSTNIGVAPEGIIVRSITTEQTMNPPGSLATTRAKVLVLDSQGSAVSDAAVSLEVKMPNGEVVKGAAAGMDGKHYVFDIAIPAAYAGTDVSATAVASATKGVFASTTSALVKVYGTTGVQPVTLPGEKKLAISSVWIAKNAKNNLIYAKVVDQDGNVASDAKVTATVSYGPLPISTKLDMRLDGSYYVGALPLLQSDQMAKITVSAAKSGYASAQYSASLLLYGRVPEQPKTKLQVVDIMTDQGNIYAKVVDDRGNPAVGAKVKLYVSYQGTTLLATGMDYDKPSGYFKYPTFGLVQSDTKVTATVMAHRGNDNAQLTREVMVYGSGAVIIKPRPMIAALWSDKATNSIYAKVVDEDGTPATPDEGAAVAIMIRPPANALNTLATATAQADVSATAASSLSKMAMVAATGNAVASKALFAYMSYDPESGYYKYSTSGMVAADTNMLVTANLYQNGRYVTSLTRTLTIYGSEIRREGNVYDSATYQWCPEGSRSFADLENCDEFGFYPASHVTQQGASATISYGELVTRSEYANADVSADVRAVGTGRTANWRVPWVEASYQSINQNYKAFIGLDGYAYLSKAKGYTWMGDAILQHGSNRYDTYATNNIRLAINGNNIRVYVNGNLEVQVNDPAPYSTGKAVFRDYNGQAGVFTNIKIAGSPQPIVVPQPMKVSAIWADGPTSNTNFIYAKVVDADGSPATADEGTRVRLQLSYAESPVLAKTAARYIPAADMSYDSSSGYWRYPVAGMFGGTVKLNALVTATRGSEKAQLSEQVTVYGSGPEPIPSPPSTHTLTLYRGWNMISAQDSGLSLSLIGASCDVRSKLWNYDGRQYQAASGFEPGKGYWVRVGNDCSVETNGARFTMQQVGLHTGWNQIGTPNENYAYDSLSSTCTVTSGPWWYDTKAGQYKKSSLGELQATLGYWVKVPGECTLAFGDGMPPAPPN